MRPSEYLGLTWKDLDLDRGTVSVSHTLEWRKGGWQFAETKRSRSRRLVKLQAWRASPAPWRITRDSSFCPVECHPTEVPGCNRTNPLRMPAVWGAPLSNGQSPVEHWSGMISADRDGAWEINGASVRKRASDVL
jgi:hypothetical protein